MNESLEYIEAYFEKQLDQAGMRQFESRCEQDTDFAREVALYITTREAMRQALAEQKKEQWRSLSDERRSTLRPVSQQAETELLPLPADLSSAPASTPVKKMTFRRWLPVAAAACILLFAITYFFNSSPNLDTQLALNIQDELQPPSPTMGISDTLEKAKSAYAKENYDQAIQYFNDVLRADSLQDYALLYKGRSFLAKKQYDSALHYFDKLSNMELFSNRGPYNAALTLLQRNQNGDRENAKKILQKIVDKKLEGSKQAQKLLERMD